MPAPIPPAAPTQANVLDTDVLVVGGGINGAGIARDLAGRGWRVVLAEQDDLGAHTSSASTKLIHGGLRYLEHGEFALVRKALQEREVLLKSAPHLIRPLRLVMPHDAAMRPAWLIRLGLFLYDHLARRAVLPGSRGVRLAGHALGAPLHARYTRGFVYSDGWVDDARLVVLAAVDARDRGARILTHTRCTRAQRSAAHWLADLADAHGVQQVRARALVNAAGPWAESFLRQMAQPQAGERLGARGLRLVQGSHILVRSRFAHDHAYLFQGADRRIVFAIPYESAFTLIGTTDVAYNGDPARVAISTDEVAYLCEQASRYFAKAVTPADVVWSYAGVRPLLDDGERNPSAATRDYLLEAQTDGAPLLTVWGGKLTTFRTLAEEAATKLGGLLGHARQPWTRSAFLPGGDFSAWIGAPQRPDQDAQRMLAALRQQHPWLPQPLAARWLRAYGSRVSKLLGGARGLADLGAEMAPGLYEAELRYLLREEWATTADDVLWRRSKLGLHTTPAEQARVAAWMATATAAAAEANAAVVMPVA